MQARAAGGRAGGRADGQVGRRLGTRAGGLARCGGVIPLAPGRTLEFEEDELLPVETSSETPAQTQDPALLPNDPDTTWIQRLFVVARSGWPRICRAGLSVQELSGSMGDLGSFLPLTTFLAAKHSIDFGAGDTLTIAHY